MPSPKGRFQPKNEEFEKGVVTLVSKRTELILSRCRTRHTARMHTLSAATLCAFAIAFGGAVRAQQLCAIPRMPSLPTATHIFSPHQEMLLGDIEAEWLEKTYNVINDDELAAHMDTIANRILSQFPADPMKVRIILIDIPEVNSYSVAAGRIYITRKMVGLLRNDDELAGLLAHEMGHILTHQNAIVVTQLFHDILGVNAVRDRQDILDKYHRVLDNMDQDKTVSRKIADRMQRQEELDEYEADRLAFNSVAAAGFSPRAFVELFDRSAQTHGRKGNFLTDFFQLTTPDERRLREIYKSLSLLPRPCREIAPAAPSAEFLAWKSAVMAYPRLAGI